LRKLLLILLVALAAPAASLAGPRDKGDGSLAIKSASGVIQLTAKGTVLGQVADGQLVITDWNPLDGNDPQVSGADRSVSRGDGITLYKGKGMRFKFVGGRYTIKITGTGIDLSAVGQGKLRILGAGTADDGQLSLNGGPFQNVSATSVAESFGQATVTPVAAGH
jgi:hypothetical protein